MTRSASPAARRIRPRAVGATIAVGALLIAMVGTALGTTYIDLTDYGLTGTTTDGVNTAVGDGVFIQGGLGSGTGNFNPFMTMSAGGSTPTEAGVNSCTDAPTAVGCHFNTYDTFYGGSRTKAIQVAGIPSILYNGELYRQFTLDSSETGDDDYMSLDQLKIFIDDQANLHEYSSTTEVFADDTGTAPVKVYDMGDTRVLMRTQTLTPGNGVSDITLLVKDSAFPEECFYGSTTCNQWLYFWNAAGGVGTSLDDDIDWDVGAGFEEWRVSLQPVVNVTKTAVPSFDRTYDWSVLKTVDPTTLNMFNGDSDDVTWSVTPTRGTPQDSNWQVSGTITVTNPTGSGPIPTAIPATVNSVADVIDGTINVNSLGTVTCPSFPTSLAAGASLQCTYSYAYGSAPAAGSHTNVASANINISASATQNYTGSATFDFANATPTVTDATATLSDSNGHTFASSIVGADSGVAIPYDETFTCATDAGQHSNTATLVEADSLTERTSTAITTVNCYALTVTKDALPTLDRSYDWTILKTANPTTLNLFNGGSSATTWTITVTRSAPVDSGWGVHGTITISNPAPMIATGVSVSDLLTGSINATVDCDPGAGVSTTVNIPAKVGSVNGQATCSYTATGLPDGTTRTNTATATLFSQNYAGTASVNFAGATVTEIDESANVNDGNTAYGPISGNASYTWNENFACGSTRQESNTASVTVVDDANDTGETHSSTAYVQVNCYGLTVSKTATTTFTRNYDWNVGKSRVLATGEIDGDGVLTTLTLDEGQTYTLTYNIAVTSTGYTDSNWAVAGTITINNPAPIAATGVAVSDLIDHPTLVDVVATVDCDSIAAGNQTTVNIAAGGLATCSYSAPLSNADARTNVATATLLGIGYNSAVVPVTFDNTPDVEIDECVVVKDDMGTPGVPGDDVTLGTVCATPTAGAFTAPKTFVHTIQVGPFAVCGPYVFTNTASIVAVNDSNDTGESDSAVYTVNIDVPCPEGCTLTWGYWKTHNESFWGGAPADPTWELLGDVDLDGTEEFEGENFFLSGMTYFEVLTTPVAGNAYFNLAHQYIATQLNFLDGADPTDAQDAFDDATALFEAYTDEYVATLKGKIGKELRAQFISLAGTLASYNEGLIGPGHCDEDPTSSAGVVMFPIGLAALLTRRLRRRT